MRETRTGSWRPAWALRLAVLIGVLVMILPCRHGVASHFVSIAHALPFHVGELVTSGPYVYARHPIYPGIMLAMIGSALAVGVLWRLLVAIHFAYFIVNSFARGVSADLVASSATACAALELPGVLGPTAGAPFPPTRGHFDVRAPESARSR